MFLALGVAALILLAGTDLSIGRMAVSYTHLMKMNVEGQNALETARALGISVESLRAKRHRIKVWINKYYRNKFEDL